MREMQSRRLTDLYTGQFSGNKDKRATRAAVPEFRILKKMVASRLVENRYRRVGRGLKALTSKA